MYCFKNGNDCPYRSICDNYAPDGNCFKMCTKFHQIDLLFHNANIPRRYLQPFTLVPSTIQDQAQYSALQIRSENTVVPYCFPVHGGYWPGYYIMPGQKSLRR